MSSDVAELERATNAMPLDWREVAVADVVAMLPGFAFKSENFVTDTHEGLPLIRIRDLGQTSTATRYVGDFDETFAVQDDDILVGMDGEFSAVRWRGGKALLNQRVLKLSTARPGALDEGYLFYRVQPALSELEQTISGTTVKHLSTKDLKRLTWQLPPLDEQRRIAEVLRSVDEAIAANEAVAVQARRTYQAALTELVGSGLDHWETVCLGQIATFVNGRGFKPHEWGDEGYPIIRIQNLNGGTDFNYYRGDFNPKILVRPGDLLFAWSGSRGTSFGPHIWRGPEGVLNYHTWKVVPVAPEDRDYLYFALRHLTKKIEDEAHGASALVHMQKAYVVDYEIQLPPPEERNAIAATLIDLQEAANNADQVYREARAMKGHLMSDLLSGRVRVPA